ncbi:hypothetical protein MalM25_29870 [Planctomycetes bacterium MalM25]|nr:hypothetical protein MalM25_29870 [Planctomycetes bacterium MalM25]
MAYPAVIRTITFLALVPATVAVADRPEFAKVGSWAYQLTGYEGDAIRRLTAAPVDLLVIDLTRDGEADYFRADEIARMQASGKHVLSYFEIAAIERFRPEWDDVPSDLMAGPVSGWEDEQYVRYWDPRWWPFVRARVDRAIDAGFDGAYLDMLTTYEEINEPTVPFDERARRMIDLVAKLAAHANGRDPAFKVVAQNCPELAIDEEADGGLNRRYMAAIDGVAIESPFYLPHNRLCQAEWCAENRTNAQSIRATGKLLLGVDYVRGEARRGEAYKRQREAGFIPYASVRELDRYVPEHGRSR